MMFLSLNCGAKVQQKKNIVFCKVVAGRAGNKPALPAHSCFIRMGSCKSGPRVFAHLSVDLWCKPSTDVLSCRRFFDRKHQARHAFCIQTTWPLLIGYIIFLLNTIFSIFSMFYGHKLHEKYVLPKSFLRKYVVLPKIYFRNLCRFTKIFLARICRFTKIFPVGKEKNARISRENILAAFII